MAGLHIAVIRSVLESLYSCASYVSVNQRCQFVPLLLRSAFTFRNSHHESNSEWYPCSWTAIHPWEDSLFLFDINRQISESIWYYITEGIGLVGVKLIFPKELSFCFVCSCNMCVLGLYFAVSKVVETTGGMVLLGSAKCWVWEYHACCHDCLQFWISMEPYVQFWWIRETLYCYIKFLQCSNKVLFNSCNAGWAAAGYGDGILFLIRIFFVVCLLIDEL